MADQDNFDAEFDEDDDADSGQAQQQPPRVPLLARPVRAVFPPQQMEPEALDEPSDGEEAPEMPQEPPKPSDPTSGYVPEAELSEEDQDDVFGVTDEDIMGDSPNKDDPFDMSDVLTVSNEDIMGKKPTPRFQKYRRTARPYPSSPQVGGLR